MKTAKTLKFMKCEAEDSIRIVNDKYEHVGKIENGIVTFYGKYEDYIPENSSEIIAECNGKQITEIKTITTSEFYKKFDDASVIAELEKSGGKYWAAGNERRVYLSKVLTAQFGFKIVNTNVYYDLNRRIVLENGKSNSFTCETERRLNHFLSERI